MRRRAICTVRQTWKTAWRYRGTKKRATRSRLSLRSRRVYTTRVCKWRECRFAIWCGASRRSRTRWRRVLVLRWSLACARTATMLMYRRWGVRRSGISLGAMR
eukprot:29201_2